MRKSLRGISAKIMGVLVLLICVGILSNRLGSFSMHSMNEKSQVVTDDCMEAVRLLGETSKSLERLQKYSMEYQLAMQNATSSSTESLKTASDNLTLVEREIDNLFTSLNEIVARFDETEMTEALTAYKTAYDNYEITMETAFANTQSADGSIKDQQGLGPGTMNDNSDEIDTAYATLYDVIYNQVDLAATAMEDQYEKSTMAADVLAIILILLGIAIMFITRILIVKPIVSANKQLTMIIDDIENEEGDLAKRIKISSKDEVGQLVAGINRFMDRLQGIMKKLQMESEKLNLSAKAVREQVISSSDRVNASSAVVEELAASMEEISATVMELSSGTGSIYDSMTYISKQVEQGYSLSKEIEARSEDFKNNAIHGKDTTNQMVDEIKDALEESIQDSKSVSKINE